VSLFGCGTIDPGSYAVSRVGPYSGILGPYAVDSANNYAVNNVTNLWGMQVVNLMTGQIITASIPDHPPDAAGLLHGIGWSPDQTWQPPRRRYLPCARTLEKPVWQDRGPPWRGFAVALIRSQLNPDSIHGGGTKLPAPTRAKNRSFRTVTAPLLTQTPAGRFMSVPRQAWPER
jgi:hypothetical protein